ncbi:MAG: DUF4307 domain-containing protein [Actinobacteria bacterium]|jgi:hypothetical protein|uniref:Unannotated protein n=1 Tax=freshwater metagenome TaxID=449393 RepID=A0A6J6JRT8_9ZZZZ|nr:DUF4307 domain-containing protein [Actinomycetota bacterium]MTA92114.1 DUF4307 domain-containing protein [Actinomycetota bacterium]
MSSVSEVMLERYGKKNDRRPSKKWVIGLASVLFVSFIAWAIWVIADGADQIRSQDLSYEILSETEATVTFSVESPAGAAVCSVQVLNQAFSVVGYREVEIPASGEYQTRINTTSLGVTGLVDECWLK